MSETKTRSLQDRFLSELCKQKIPVKIIITNGFQIKNAVVAEFDSFVVLVESEGAQTLLFKHAISSIVPETRIEV